MRSLSNAFRNKHKGVMDFIATPGFWTALCNIVFVNIVLSGDNAVVIALAARALPAAQQKKAVFYGGVAAIAMRIVLTIFALQLLTLPYLKIAGSGLLLYIGMTLMADDGNDNRIRERLTLAAAIRTILIADLVMSLDNVLGVAAAAKDNVPLLITGLVISIPLIVFGSSLVLRLMQKFPFVTVMGAALLGYLAGEMLLSDVALGRWIDMYLSPQAITWQFAGLAFSVPGLVGALVTVSGGYLLLKNKILPN